MSIKRSIRQRLWSDDQVKGQAVGENVRNLDSAIGSMPPIRVEVFDDVIYETGGLVFAADRLPAGTVVIYVAKADGSWQSVNAVPELDFSGSFATAKISGLTAGERYSTIRLLVVG